MTTLKHPSLHPDTPIRIGTSLKESLTALQSKLNRLPNDPVSLSMYVADKWVEIDLVNRVMMSLICYKEKLPKPLHRWHTLCLRTPTYPQSRQGPSGQEYPNLAPAEFRGKTIKYNGAWGNVPFPWFTLGSLTRFGVEVVDIQRVVTSAQLTQLAANAHCDGLDSLDLPLTLRVLGVNGESKFYNPAYQTDWAEPVRNSSHYRLRTVNVGVVEPEVRDIYYLISAPMTQVTEIDLDITRHEKDTVLSGLRLCRDLKKLSVKYRWDQHQTMLRTVCERLELSVTTHRRGGNIIVVAEKQGLERFI
ncbi:hypothetical protein EV715DRAFT_293098 [Schizophyllum commune]